MDELIYAQKKTVASAAMEEEVHMIPETIFVFNQQEVHLISIMEWRYDNHLLDKRWGWK